MVLVYILCSQFCCFECFMLYHYFSLKWNVIIICWHNKKIILLFIMMKSFNQKIYSKNILFLKDAIYIVSVSYEQFYKLFSSALLYIRANTGDNCPSTIRGPVVSVRVTASPGHEDIQITAAEWGNNIKNVSNGKSTIYNCFLLARSELNFSCSCLN